MITYVPTSLSFVYSHENIVSSASSPTRPDEVNLYAGTTEFTFVLIFAAVIVRFALFIVKETSVEPTYSKLSLGTFTTSL